MIVLGTIVPFCGHAIGAEVLPAPGATGCQAIEGLSEHLTAGRVFLLGELHGTSESPAFALSVACQAVEAGLDVVVGMELSPGAQAGVDAFLASAGGPEDRSGCGVAAIRGRGSGARGSIEIDEATRPAGHRGWYHVGEITASPPATGAPWSQDLSRLVSDTTNESSAFPPEPEPTESEVLPPAASSSSPSVTKLQGHWQAYESGARSWTIRFDGASFHAVLGADDWYKGGISIRPGEKPAQIDFRIEECRCSFRGQTSKAIYRWEDSSMILATPRPGSPRPTVFNANSGQVVELKRLGD